MKNEYISFDEFFNEEEYFERCEPVSELNAVLFWVMVFILYLGS
jgi:hypothetical protein